MCFHNVTHRDGLDSVSARLKSHTNPPDLEPTNHNQIATAERLGKPGEGGRGGEEEEEEQEEEGSDERTTSPYVPRGPAFS